ncbi:MAG TPA: hypothetical protein VMM37_00375, partial [Bacteroidota bacterium]|nr:hypothetical protein [Bacteroidota bacterium]
MPPPVVPAPDRVARKSSSDLLPLFEFSNVVNSSLDLNFILGTVLLTVMGKMLVSKGIVLLKRPEGAFEVIARKGLEQVSVGQKVAIERPLRSIASVAKLRATER